VEEDVHRRATAALLSTENAASSLARAAGPRGLMKMRSLRESGPIFLSAEGLGGGLDDTQVAVGDTD
jgi:hypothetical protein